MNVTILRRHRPESSSPTALRQKKTGDSLRGRASASKTEVEDPDRELVERVQSELPYGTAAFSELVRRHTSRVYGRSYGILRSGADAEEAVQDVFLAAFRSLPKYRFERPFVHWLNTVTLNACRMILRKRASEQRRRRSAQEQAPPPEHPTPPDVALRALVIELLDTLDPGTRMPLLMRFVEGYTYVEIAEQLDLSESAVKMRVSRGAKKLREIYEERVGKDGIPTTQSPGGDGPARGGD